MSVENDSNETHLAGDAAALDDLEIAALATGELTGSEREDALRRLIRSPEAVEKYRILTELHVAAGAIREPRLGNATMYGVAATVVIAVLIGAAAISPLWDVFDRYPSDSVRTPVAYTVTPGDNALLDQFPLTFEWPEVPGAQRYRVRLFDAAAEQIWLSQWSNVPELAFEGDQRLALDTGTRFFWVVEIEGRASQREIGPFWFSTGEP